MILICRTLKTRSYEPIRIEENQMEKKKIYLILLVDIGGKQIWHSQQEEEEEDEGSPEHY